MNQLTRTTNRYLVVIRDSVPALDRIVNAYNTVSELTQEFAPTVKAHAVACYHLFLLLAVLTYRFGQDVRAFCDAIVEAGRIIREATDEIVSNGQVVRTIRQYHPETIVSPTPYLVLIAAVIQEFVLTSLNSDNFDEYLGNISS
jgi:hypothetical protein